MLVLLEEAVFELLEATELPVGAFVLALADDAAAGVPEEVAVFATDGVPEETAVFVADAVDEVVPDVFVLVLVPVETAVFEEGVADVLVLVWVEVDIAELLELILLVDVELADDLLVVVLVDVVTVGAVVVVVVVVLVDDLLVVVLVDVVTVGVVVVVVVVLVLVVSGLISQTPDPHWGLVLVPGQVASTVALVHPITKNIRFTKMSATRTRSTYQIRISDTPYGELLSIRRNTMKKGYSLEPPSNTVLLYPNRC